HCLVLEAAREAIAQARTTILHGATAPGAISAAELGAIRADALNRLNAKLTPSLRAVINATGTLLHTNLGRAPLCQAAIDNIASIAHAYSNLELDLETGKRGHRYSHVDELLCRLTGAEAAAVVNNNAGAVLLALTALARGREAIVSRGELVEIGGSFRVPDVMEAGGVTLREVGTTNKTHLSDYVQALREQTGLLLKVHTSNYRIIGFTQSVSAAELVELGHQHEIPVMEDLGSGMLFDLSEFGLPQEPTVSEQVAAGVDVITFSGDKLLGGPQAGLIVGKKWAIDKIRNHPLARALRMDKLTLAALETTLYQYLDHRKALDNIPILQMLNMSETELAQRTAAFAQKLKEELGSSACVDVIVESSCVGGGALPATILPGCAVAIRLPQQSLATLALTLRQQQPAVVGRNHDGALILNLRTVFPQQQQQLIHAVSQAVNPAKTPQE
ncbi:MAG: L-seryl-tRNA(Sec) selenium transferase, partial [Desulfuromonadaceae bacterium]|nr:L-seryl-tRNA(Sec) selenium transferase [Desulfuromonadaceae bacterium]